MATRKAGAAGKGAPRAPKKATPEAAPDAGVSINLNPRQRRFVVEYLKDKNAAAAYRRVYGASVPVSETAGPRLFRNDRVRSEIVRLESVALAQVQRETGITLERTLREVARLAFFDPRKLFTPEGKPLHITELDDDTASAVAGLDVLEQFEGYGEDRRAVGEIKKWKIADKKGALDMLMKHLGAYIEDNKQKQAGLPEQVAAFIAGIHEFGAGRLPTVTRQPR